MFFIKLDILKFGLEIFEVVHDTFFDDQEAFHCDHYDSLCCGLMVTSSHKYASAGFLGAPTMFLVDGPYLLYMVTI